MNDEQRIELVRNCSVLYICVTVSHEKYMDSDSNSMFGPKQLINIR